MSTLLLLHLPFYHSIRWCQSNHTGHRYFIYYDQTIFQFSFHKHLCNRTFCESWIRPASYPSTRSRCDPVIDPVNYLPSEIAILLNWDYSIRSGWSSDRRNRLSSLISLPSAYLLSYCSGVHQPHNLLLNFWLYELGLPNSFFRRGSLIPRQPLKQLSGRGLEAASCRIIWCPEIFGYYRALARFSINVSYIVYLAAFLLK